MGSLSSYFDEHFDQMFNSKNGIETLIWVVLLSLKINFSGIAVIHFYFQVESEVAHAPPR